MHIFTSSYSLIDFAPQLIFIWNCCACNFVHRCKSCDHSPNYYFKRGRDEKVFKKFQKTEILDNLANFNSFDNYLWFFCFSNYKLCCRYLLYNLGVDSDSASLVSKSFKLLWLEWNAAVRREFRVWKRINKEKCLSLY